jgi:hypothetical protein
MDFGKLMGDNGSMAGALGSKAADAAGMDPGTNTQCVVT